MNDERRERYAAAMAAAFGHGPEWSFEWGREADAAMAVADGEISAELSTQDGYTAKMRDEIERWRIENARLRAELVESADTLDESAQLLEDALNEGERLRAELREVKKVADRRESWLSTLRAEFEEAHRLMRLESANVGMQMQENDRLRAELERSQAEEVESRIRASEAEATISRVRAVLDGWRDGDVHYPYIAVRDALNGESE